jgi:hypothetical protein
MGKFNLKKVAKKVVKSQVIGLDKAKQFAGTKTGKSLIKVGKTALAGDVYGLEKMGVDRLGKAIGKDNLRKGQAFGEKTMGKKNYQATAKGVKRGNRVGANATSAYLAYARGDPVSAAKYTGRTAEAAMGTQALRKIHGAVKDKIGEKNYDTLNNSYKATRHGVTLGYNLAHLSNTNTAFQANNSLVNAGKMGIAGYHTAHSAKTAYDHIKEVGTQAKQEGRPNYVAPGSTTTTRMQPAAPIGGGGGMRKKPTTY